MRQIKFRVWDKRLGDWRYFELSDVYGWGQDNPNGYCDVKLSEAQQFTGLLDKNGKEIYEGDILKWNESRIMKVIWGSVGWTLWSDLFKSFGHPDGNDCGEYHTKSYCLSSEIIGNIYENPELLSN